MIHNPADGSVAERVFTGSARRRRERRLRSFLRHELMTVRMELAAALHHSSFRGAGPEMYDAPRRQRTANSRVGPAEYYELSSDDGRPTGGERPAALLEPWPQGQVQRHDGIAYELVQALDALVLQTVEQLPNVVQFFATQLPVVAEPVIEVPKILPHDVPPRRLCRDTQLVEQLVEVPTIVSWSLLQRIVEQHVGIPVPGGGGRRGRKRRTRLWPKLERRRGQDVDIPVPGGGRSAGLQGFLPGQSSSSSSRDPARGFEALDEPGYGFFRTFPQNKKSATLPAHSWSALPPHSSPWTPSACDVPMVLEEEEEEGAGGGGGV